MSLRSAQAPQAALSHQPASRLRWLMISLAFLATVVNYLDRQTLSIVLPAITEQFHLTDVSYSRIVSAFMLAYTIMNGISGPLIDRLGTRLGYALCMAWWSAAGALHAFSRGALSFGVFRFLLGMGEAGNWPAALKVVAEWFPVEERALASGIFNSGSSIGSVLAPPLVAGLALAWGWRAPFVLVGLCGFLWLALWWRLYYTPAEAQAESRRAPMPAWRLLRTRWVATFTASKVFSDPAWYFYTFWFPKYLSTERGFDLASIGKYAWIPYLTAGAGNLVGGAFSAAILRFGMKPVRARKLSVVFFAALMAAAIPAVLAPTAAGAIALVSVATFGYTGALANLLALPIDVFPKNTVGSIWGLASMGAGFGGMLFALLTGWALKHYSYVPVFFGFGVMPLVAAAMVCTLPATVAGISDAAGEATPETGR